MPHASRKASQTSAGSEVLSSPRPSYIFWRQLSQPPVGLSFLHISSARRPLVHASSLHRQQPSANLTSPLGVSLTFNLSDSEPISSPKVSTLIFPISVNPLPLIPSFLIFWLIQLTDIFHASSKRHFLPYTLHLLMSGTLATYQSQICQVHSCPPIITVDKSKFISPNPSLWIGLSIYTHAGVSQ